MFWKDLKQTLKLRVIITAGVLLLTLLSYSDALSGPFNEHSFKPTFKQSVALYLPEYDYLWLVAQCRQESSFDPFAVSPAGAKGYCQFMSGTWFDCQRKLGIIGSRFEPRKNIKCAAWYMGTRVRVWSGRDRTADERLPLAQASYNCGTACVLRAQERCNNGRLFYDISHCLPLETQEYPIKISKFFKLFKNRSPE